MKVLLGSLLGYLVLGVMASATASAEECSGTITAEEVLRAEDARYAAQIANDAPRTRFPRSERRRTFIAVPPRSVWVR